MTGFKNPTQQHQDEALRRLGQNLARWATNNEVVLPPTVTAPASAAGGFVDYGFGSSSNTHLTFQLTHTKQQDETIIVVHADATWFGTTNPGPMILGVLVDGTAPTIVVGRLHFNELSSHKMVSGTVSIPDLAKGDHTYKLRVNSASANTPTINFDVNDYASFSVREVSAA